MRSMGLAAVAGLFVVATLHGQTVRDHSSRRIPTPAIDVEEAPRETRRMPTVDRSRTASSNDRGLGELISLESNVATVDEGSNAGESSSMPVLVGDPPALRSLRDAGSDFSSATDRSLPSLVPIGSRTQYYGPSVAGASSRGAVTPAGFSAPMTTSAPGASWSSPIESSPVISQTSFSAPTTSAYGSAPCCGGSTPLGTTVVGMPPTASTPTPMTSYSASPTYPPTMSYGPTTVYAPPVADAASYPPTLANSTIPQAPFAPQASCPPGGGPVPFLVDPVAVNIPAVPIEERLQPVIALRPGVPEESYVGRGVLGQPEVYVNGQHVRNVLRYLTLW